MNCEGRISDGSTFLQMGLSSHVKTQIPEERREFYSRAPLLPSRTTIFVNPHTFVFGG